MDVTPATPALPASPQPPERTEADSGVPRPAPSPADWSRRTVLAAGVVGAAGSGLVLAGCGAASSSSTVGRRTGPVTVAAADVPVGGGKIDASAAIVVTQPTAGVFKAFTAICTHQGCTVAGVSDGKILCPCHGSVFSAADGSVLQGPATTALAAKTVTASGTDLIVS